MNVSREQLKAILERLKDFKELILIIVFFGSGVAWTINYFATREQLESYKCINDLTLSMLVNTKSAEFLTEVVRAARKDLRATDELRNNTPKTTENEPLLRSISDQIDDQKANLEKLSRSRDDAEKTRETALKKLQAIQIGSMKPCN
jgi:hypothetical protein